jgi:hypothetical protein
LQGGARLGLTDARAAGPETFTGVAGQSCGGRAWEGGGRASEEMARDAEHQEDERAYIQC